MFVISNLEKKKKKSKSKKHIDLSQDINGLRILSTEVIYLKERADPGSLAAWLT